MKEKELTFKDRTYDEETVKAITELRHERWALMCIQSTTVARTASKIFSQKAMLRIDKRLEEVNAQLFKLTENPIYRVR